MKINFKDMQHYNSLKLNLMYMIEHIRVFQANSVNHFIYLYCVYPNKHFISPLLL